MDWMEITILTTSEAADAITSIIHDMGLYVSIQDPKDIVVNYNEHTMDTVWDSSLMKTQDTIIKVYLDNEFDNTEKIKIIKEAVENTSKFINIGKGEIIINSVKEEDWANNWKQYYKPLKIGERIIIKPSWESVDNVTQEEIVVEMDPGAAFGTGTHETTKLSIELLQKYVLKDDRMLDIGCGSGILSICGAKLGASKVIGVDIDPLAIKASEGNVKLNNLENVEIRQGNLLDVVEGTFDIAVANIIADIVILVIKSLSNYLKVNGIFICSGVIKERLEDVSLSLVNNRFEILQVKEDGEWIAIASKRIG